MKSLRLIFIIWVMLILMGGYSAYSEESNSGVSVLGSSPESSSRAESSGTPAMIKGITKMEISGLDSGIPKTESSDEKAPDIAISGSTSNFSSRLLYEISGSKIGEVKVSQPVILPSEGVIMYVNAAPTQALVIVKVGEDGKEAQILNISPERLVGARLPKGVYKVYPQDPDGTFGLAKLTATIQIGLVESKIEAGE